MPCTTIMKARTGSCALTAGLIRDAGSTGV